MEGIRPCPYCGGEVEVIRLNRKKTTDPPIFRIECRRCRRLVVKGTKFEKETDEEGAERIAQYEKFVSRVFNTPGSTRIRQSAAAKIRDRQASLSSRLDSTDREY